MKNKKKNYKNYKQDDVVEKKIKTMENGKEYYKEVEKNENEDSIRNKNE